MRKGYLFMEDVYDLYLLLTYQICLELMHTADKFRTTMTITVTLITL